MLLALLVITVAYLLGSIPSGYIAGRLSGVDVRQQGSGNIGATNVLRVLGKGWGFAVFFTDALKGFAAGAIALEIIRRNPQLEHLRDFYGILAAAACIAGHSFPVWLKFRGGKGVATAAGAIFGVMPLAAIAIFIVWVLVFATTRYVSVASIAAALALPLVIAALMQMEKTHGVVLLYFSTLMTALVVWRHWPNIVRLANGTEPRFTRK